MRTPRTSEVTASAESSEFVGLQVLPGWLQGGEEGLAAAGIYFPGLWSVRESGSNLGAWTLLQADFRKERFASTTQLTPASLMLVRPVSKAFTFFLSSSHPGFS